MMTAKVRLIISALISFVFYFCWSYWANQMVSTDQALVLRSAIVQGTLSATITVVFTLVLEKSVAKFAGIKISLLFVVPIICSVHSKSRENIAIFKAFNSALNTSAKFLSGNAIPGTLLAPLLPIFCQATIAIAINLLNQTPNLWLTVAPSIIMTAIYGYMYTFTLLTQQQNQAYLK
jgi:hypothetical protein